MIGRVIDASALDAAVANEITADSWPEIVSATSTPLYLRALAVSEVRSYRPDRLDAIDRLLRHPSILYRDIQATDRGHVVRLFEQSSAFDVCAAHSVVVGRVRGWPVITRDVERLRRLDPGVEVLILPDGAR